MFNIPQNGNPTLIFAPRTVSSTRSRDVGAIVGGVVGGVAGVIALGLLGFYCIRRRQDNTFFARAVALEEEHKVASTVEPYTYGAAPGSPPVSPHPHDPLLLQAHDAHPHIAPPTYEEASEVGTSSPTAGAAAAGAAAGGARAYPREKQGYRRDTAFSGYSDAPSSPGFAGPSNNV